MIRLMLVLFIVLTVLATTMTYTNAGLKSTRYKEPSVRSGSRSTSHSSGGFFGGYSSGGYRGGK